MPLGGTGWPASSHSGRCCHSIGIRGGGVSVQWGETYPAWLVRQCVFLFPHSPLLFILSCSLLLFLSSPASCKLLVETSSISHLTPSLISHCALVHCDSSVLTFDTIVDTWLDKAPVQHNLSAMRSVCLSSQTVYGRVQTLLPVLLFHVALRLWPQ